MKIIEFVEYLRCPMTADSLKLVDARPEDGPRFVPAPRKGRDVRPLSGKPTERMLVPESESFAYPVVDGIPVLLGPERLLPAHRAAAHPAIDLRDPMYAEAYEEMEFYNDPDAFPPLRSIMGALTDHRDIDSIADSFPDPARFWIDALHDSLPQLEAYRYLAPVAGRTVLQIGGSGSHVVKMLLAGADRGFLVTPMIAEARYAEWLARRFRVRDRFAPVLGIGEQIPFAEDSVDLVYSGGCFHHMRLKFISAELHRVLAKGGKFSGADPYKTFLHAVGTKLLGKREKNVYCRPITPERLMEMKKWFPNMTANRHGPLLRYLFLGLEKLSGGRFRLPLPIMMKLMRVDNFLGRMARSSETTAGGAVVMSGTKSMRSAQGSCVRNGSPAPGSGGVRTEEARHMLLIGPPPHREGGGRSKFEVMLEYFSNIPNLVVHQVDLPVHRPLYREDGGFGPLRHSLTIVDLLRAMVRMARVDTVILVGSPDFCFSYGSVLALWAKLLRVPSAAVVAGGRGMFSSEWLPAPARAACLALFRAVGRIMVQTEVARNDLPARLQSKTRVFTNFRPLPPRPPGNRCHEEEIRFVFVGRHDDGKSSTSNKPEKGLDVLLEAFERARAAPGLAERAELHVYGPIPMNLTGRVQRAPDVFSHGRLPNGELRAALRRYDVLAFPSRFAFEGHPGAIVEAFMAGLPVIASDLPGPMEIVEHEVNGLVVPTDDPDAFAEAMNRLAADHGLRRRLAAGAWASASRFDQEKVLPELAAAIGLLPGRDFTTEG